MLFCDYSYGLLWYTSLRYVILRYAMLSILHHILHPFFLSYVNMWKKCEQPNFITKPISNSNFENELLKICPKAHSAIAKIVYRCIRLFSQVLCYGTLSK